MRSAAPALLPIFRSTHQAGLLSRMFLSEAEVPMTDLARDLDVPLTTLHREVERLEVAGLLSSRRVGRSRLVRANRVHPGAGPLTELLMVTFGPIQVVAEEFGGLDAAAVAIFGAWARRFDGETGKFPGVVDVLVVSDYAARSQVDKVAEVAQRRLGLAVNAILRSVGEWESEPYEPLVAEIRQRAFVPVLLADARGGAEPEPPYHGGCVYRLRPKWIPHYQPDVYVPADLNALAGPTSGRYDPPVNMYWQPGELDFAEPGDVELFYSSALTTTTTATQFAQWVNKDALAAAWHRLSLPARVRCAWETIHPILRAEDVDVNDRILIQDAVLTAIAEHGFALAGGSALIDYDVVSRDTDDIDAFNNRWDAAAFDAARVTILRVCRDHGWSAQTLMNEDFRKQVLVDAGTGQPVTVDIVYFERSRDPERRAGGGLRLIFDDVVGGKGVALADSARGRDFFDLANILETPGWSLGRVEEAMRAIKYGDAVDRFRTNIERFRHGEFDDDIRKSGFDPAFCHRIID